MREIEPVLKNKQAMMNINNLSAELVKWLMLILALTLSVRSGAPSQWPEAHGQGSV